MSDLGRTNTSHIKIQNQPSENLICFPDTSTQVHHGSCSLSLWRSVESLTLFSWRLCFSNLPSYISMMLIWASYSFSSRQKEAKQGLRKKMTRCWQMRLSLPEQWDNALFMETRKEEKTKEDLNLEDYQSLLSILMWFIKECLMVECTLTFCWNGFTVNAHVLFLTREYDKITSVPWCLLGEYVSF